MKASKLIEILAHHMNDEAGGDFEVYVSDQTDTAVVTVEKAILVERCWLYPGLKRIVIDGD